MTPRHLFLVRHAQAAWDQKTPADFDRLLTPVGEADADALATWLRDHAPPPDAVISSPAPRALATADRLTAAWPDAPGVTLEPGLYEAPLDAPQRHLAELNDSWRVVVVVGHNPSLSHCADWLIGEPTILELPAGGMVWLEITAEHWHELTPGSARVRAVYNPGTDSGAA
jgi:phosphohistidine phosphatase